ncbi:hypothetical protein J0H58_19675 [bacterium]|nr:hypothetical protein [bacterium]
MQTLLAFFGSIANGLRALVGLVLPVFAEAADFRGWPGWLKVVVGLLLAAGLAALAYAAQARGWVQVNPLLGDVVRPARPFFLAALVLLVVALAWLLYTLWLLASRDEAAAEFPDIEAAWAEATRRLSSAGLGPADSPLYLVLGRPAAGTDALFLAAGVTGVIRAPSGGEPPVRVYAWNEAIYVTCARASAWGMFCQRLTGEDENAWAQGGDPDPSVRETLGPGQVFDELGADQRGEMQALMQAARVRELEPHEQDRLRELAERAAATPPPRKKLRLPENAQAEAVRRLRYLCRLIRRDRRPWCPVNGLVVLVPWAAAETDDTARAGSGVLQRDLNAARTALQLRYPTYAVVCDLETARGFAEFRSGFPADVLRQRIGQRLPLGPDVDAPAVPRVVADAVQWVGSAVLPAWIHRFLQLGPTDPRPTPTGESLHNRNLYLLMRAVYDRAPRLALLLSRGLPPVHGPAGDPAAGLPLFAGCYLAGTGRTPDGQAFVPGVLQRVSDGQNLVAWAPEALAEDARLNRLTALGYAGAVLLAVIAVAALAGWAGILG